MLKGIKPDGDSVYIIADEKQRFYFTGFKSSFGYLVITEKENVYYTDLRYLSAVKARLKGSNVKVEEANSFEPVKKYIADNGFKKIGIDYTVTFVSDEKDFKSTGLEVFDISDELCSVMAIKTPEELKIIKESCKIAEESFYEVIQLLRTGITEKEVANEFEYIMKKKGAEDVSFDLIIAFGANSAVPHHETDDTKLKENDVVLMDFGCLYKGYCSDMTRTFIYGEPSEGFVKDYNAVLLSAKTAEENIKAGMTGRTADAFARDVLGKAGLATYFTHSLGHGIGVNIHEYPRLSVKADNVLKNNMVFSIEPGVYLDGAYGIRIEDTVALIDGKVERFMTDDKSLMKIDIKK